MNLTIDGVDEVVQMLTEEVPLLVRARGLLKGGEAAAKVIAAELYAHTPVEGAGARDKGDPRLRDSIKKDITIDSQGRGVEVNVGFGKQGFKANFVEYGHRMVGHKPNKQQLGTVSPKPFIRPAALAAHESATEAFAAGMREGFKGTKIDG